jgi:hypothetical protein
MEIRFKLPFSVSKCPPDAKTGHCFKSFPAHAADDALTLLRIHKADIISRADEV